MKSKGLCITFLLPGPGHIPVGGLKVAYEYANGLSRLGHAVVVVHPASLYIDTPLKRKPRLMAGYIYRGMTGKYRPNSWFPLDSSVRMRWTPSLAARYVPDADVVIATAWQTAEWASQYPASKGRQFYLIQHLETWNGHLDRMYRTWTAPLEKIVIARWLERIALDLGQKATHIPNGLDFTKFYVQTPITERDPNSVAMLFQDYDWKGSADGVRALCIVREQVPDLRATLFGVPPRPPSLPGWIHYHSCPPQDILRGIYNSVAIFVAPSWAEGWPLPPAEAMMCGAALVGTDIGGHQEYAIHEETALLSPAKDPAGLAVNLKRLIDDPELRLRIARAGNAFIQQFTWDRAVRSMEQLLTSHLSDRDIATTKSPSSALR
jgi:glycosyltransferase involved in cell wall biosynthesis